MKKPTRPCSEEAKVVPHRLDFSPELGLRASVNMLDRWRRVRSITRAGVKHYYMVAWRWSKMPIFLKTETVEKFMAKRGES